MIVTFDDLTWDTNDLDACESALKQILVDGADEDCITELENDGKFGDLDVTTVVKEMIAETSLVDESLYERV